VLEHFLGRRLVRRPLAVKRQRRRASRQTSRRAASANACSSSRTPTSWQIHDTMSAPVAKRRKAATRQLVLLPREAVVAALPELS
jgi:hypothetical protein